MVSSSKGTFAKLDLLRSLEFVASTGAASDVGPEHGSRVVLSVHGAGEAGANSAPCFSAEFDKLRKVKKFTGGASDIEHTLLLHDDACIALVGVGETKANSAASTVEAYYFQGAQAAKTVVLKNAAEHLIVHFEAPDATMEMICAFLNRMLYVILASKAEIEVPAEALYATGKGPKKPADSPATPAPKRLTVLAPQLDESVLKAVFNTARTLAEASTAIQLVVNCPPNILECQFFAELIEKEAKKYNDKVTCKILTEVECKALGMGAFTAVASGSKYGCRLVHLTYSGPVAAGVERKKICLVGKGITMDTGGYNLKTNDSIVSMKCDMAGAATMLFTLFAIAQLEIEGVEVHAIGAMCENMIDKDAYRPGDILKASNGKTIEITNTDAEGRLALCDALVYAEREALGGAGKGVIIDAATLTGAALIALGAEVAAVMSNRDELREKILTASTRAGEAMWGLPLRARYLKKTEGPFTDLMNTSFGSRNAGTIIAGLFLEQFVSEETEWAHIDVAGAAWNFDDRSGTGFGVASLINFIAERAS